MILIANKIILHIHIFKKFNSSLNFSYASSSLSYPIFVKYYLYVCFQKYIVLPSEVLSMYPKSTFILLANDHLHFLAITVQNPPLHYHYLL